MPTSAARTGGTGWEYRPGLDGLRALAVLAVLAFHDGRLQGGFLGVSTFFTLSGFLITGLLVHEWETTGGVSLRGFFGRRARRLLPAAFAGIVVAAAVTAVAAGRRHGFPGDGLAALFDGANWRFLATGHSYVDVFAAPSALAHYWSLAVEEQFYLVLAPLFAVLLVALRGRRAHIGVVIGGLTLASFVDGWLGVRHGIDRAYYGTDTRALEFLIGALFAVAISGRRLRRAWSRSVAIAGVVALAAMVAATVLARSDQRGLFRGGLLAYAGASALVVLAACEPGPLQRVLSVWPLRALGRISYGVYVFHWPLFLWLTAARTGLHGVALSGVRVVVTLAVASFSFVLIERPVRTGRRIQGVRRWILTPAGAGACVAAVFAAGVAPAGGAAAVQFTPAVQPQSVLAHATRPPPRSSHRHAHAHVAVTVGRVMVVGDSVALTLGRGIERWGARNGIAVLNDGKLGCSLLDGARVRGYWGIEYRPVDACHARAEWNAWLHAFRPDVVVVLFGAWDVYDASWDGATWHTPGDAVWDAHYASLVAGALGALRATAARVVWLAPPCFVPNPTNPGNGGPWFDPGRSAAVAAVDRAVVRGRGVAVSDVVRVRGCPVNLTLRPDGVHYSDPGADVVAGALGPVIRG